MVENDADAHFVYSCTAVQHFKDYTGKPIDFPFKEEELRVTAIPDAHGIGKIHSLLDLAGKRDRLDILTSHTFRPRTGRRT